MPARPAAPLSAYLHTVQSTDIGMLVRMVDLALPRVWHQLMPQLDARQRRALARALPAGRHFFVAFPGAPTRPILVQLGQPPRLLLLPPGTLQHGCLRGVRIPAAGLDRLARAPLAGSLWLLGCLLGQLSTLAWIAAPFLRLALLGPRALRDLGLKFFRQMHPVLRLVPNPVRDPDPLELLLVWLEGGAP